MRLFFNPLSKYSAGLQVVVFSWASHIAAYLLTALTASRELVSRNEQDVCT
jgi:hypothetical protein